MKRSRRFWIEIGVLVFILAVVIAGICLNNWWHAPGVRVLGDKAKVEIYDTGYVFDFTSGEFMGMADVMIDGELKDKEFNGYIEVEGHHIPFERLKGDGGGAGGSIKGDTIEIDYRGDNTGDLMISEGEFSIAPNDDPVAEYDVAVKIDTGEYVIEVRRTASCVVIGAEDKETALQRYNEFMEEIWDNIKQAR